jgi:hypothetical protein
VVRSAADIPLRFGAVDDGANAAPLSGDLFEPRHSSGGLRLAMVLGFGLLVGAGALYIVFGGEPADGTTSAGTDTTVVTHAPAAAEPPALELVSLRHSRQGDTWTIAGMVRNPADAPELQRPAAIAFLFDKEGGFVGSGRATIELNTLSPGDESPFVVSVTATGPVERYRISFRSADGKVLRHVDRRNVPRS